MSVTAPRAAVRFTEEMLGHVTFGETDYDRGAIASREGAVPLKFHLTIEAADLSAFAADPSHEGVATGYVHCDALGGLLPVERGVFNLFVNTSPGTKRMLYRLWFADGVGHPLTLAGFKRVHDDPGFDLWRDTTTLFTRVLQGHVDAAQEAGAEVVASGVLRIRVRDFARQLTSFRTRGPTLGAQAGALLRFGRLFSAQLAQVYLRSSASAGETWTPQA